jgi:hypothetical protein
MSLMARRTLRVFEHRDDFADVMGPLDGMA